MNVAVIVPAFNESRKIGEVVKNLAVCDCSIIVVDDGSEDETAKIAEQNGALVLRHEVNLGQGAALRTGSQYAYQNNFDLIAHFDADGQHSAEDLKKMLNIFKTDKVDALLGSRFMGQSFSGPIVKKIILKLAKIFSKLILQLQYSDPQNGLRIFRANIFPKIIWQNDDYLHCTEILCHLKKNDLAVKEFPMVVLYDEYSSTKKVKPKVSMGLKIFWEKLLNRL